MRSRCFSGPQRAITTASDRTKAKGDIAIYKGNRSLNANGNSLPHRGVRVARCTNGNTFRKVISVQSYELLNSLVRGNYYSNPTLDGATSQAHYESWGAAFQSQVYGGNGNPAPVSDYTSVPSDCSAESCTWIDPGYPHYQIDNPTGLSGGGGLLTERCIPPPGAKRLGPWNATARIAFKNTNAYWTARNAQPLQGMVLHAPIHLTGAQCESSKMEQEVQFCQGKDAIN